MIVRLFEVVSMWERKDFSILQDIGRRLEKNAEERAKILQTINDNKIARNQRDGDIEKEIVGTTRIEKFSEKLSLSCILKINQLNSRQLNSFWKARRLQQE